MVQPFDQMRRRTLLALTGAAAVTGVGGCSALPGSDGGPDEESDGDVPDGSDPAAVVEAYVQTRAGSRENRLALYHDVVVAEDAFDLQDIETEVNERSLDEAEVFNLPFRDVNPESAVAAATGAESAIVTATVSVVEDGDQRAETQEWLLATEDGEWRLLGQIGDRYPSAAFNFDYDAANGTLTITKQGGDAVRAKNLYVRGDRIAPAPTDSWHEIEGSGYDAHDAISAGQSIEIGVEGGEYVCSVVWEYGDTSKRLATDEGPGG